MQKKLLSFKMTYSEAIVKYTNYGQIAFTARPKIKSQSQIYRYGRSIFCLPHRPKISGFFDLCLHWVSVVRACQLDYETIGDLR